MIDETDPAIRAVRAPFAGIRAELGDRMDEARRTYEAQRAEHEKYVADRTAWEEQYRAAQAAEPAAAERPAAPARRVRRSHLEDPSETGFYSASWMRKH